jgi:hypothetical protein
VTSVNSHGQRAAARKGFMRIERTIAGFLIVLLFTPSVQAQGTFQNLNFEQADPIFADYPLYVTAASAWPY